MNVVYRCVNRDKVLCTKHFLSVYARLFLEKKERSVTRFVADFQKLSVSDEKVRSKKLANIIRCCFV